MADIMTKQTTRLNMLNGGGGEGESSCNETEETTNSSAAVDIEDDEEEEEEEEEDEQSNDARLSIGQSPRYEAFVMTGEKILRLNPKISPNYAKLKQSELPKHTEILNSPPSVRQGPFSDLENRSTSTTADGRGGAATKALKVSKGVGGDAGVKQQYRNNHRFQLQLDNDEFNKMPVSQSENMLNQQNFATSGSGIVGNGADSATDRLRNSKGGGGASTKDGSIITVHGTFRACDSDNMQMSNRALPSDRATNAALHFGRCHAVELPSPVSPVFLSEPVSPAKYAFGNASKKEDQQRLYDRLLNRNHSHSTERNASPSVIVDNTTLLIHVSTTSSGDIVATNGFQKAASASSSSPSCSVSSSSKDKHSRPPNVDALEVNKNCNGANTCRSLTSSKRDLDSDAAKRLAKRLHSLDGFSKSDVAKHLQKNNEFGAAVATEYLKLFNFAGLRVDAAMRKFLCNFCLTGETSERERILLFFSRRYYECNPLLFASEDEVHTLICALLLLNTDLHGQNVTKRMSCRDFIENVSQTSFKYSRALLKTLYESIKTTPIEWARDLTDSETTDSGLPSQSQLLDSRFVEIPDPDSQVEYKKGWVMRKCVVDNDGRKMPFGRRSWREFYATLKGMVLYLHKDELGFKKGSFHTFRNAVRVHHALAEKANDYTKKQHVFRLQTATLAEYLFQTSDPQEMKQWIDSINFVAACFSSPPLPAPTSSRQTFHRPFLPSSITKLSISDQLRDHERRVADLHKQLHQHRQEAPSRNARPRMLQTYAEKEVFLIYELQRYSTYANFLRQRLEDLIEPPLELHFPDDSLDADDLAEILPQSGQSGQSDRLSYRAAINCAMTPTASTAGYETTF